MKAWAKAVPEKGLAGMGEYCCANMWASGFDKRTNEPYGHAYYTAAAAAGATEGYVMDYRTCLLLVLWVTWVTNL
jgi:hypothetical protein